MHICYSQGIRIGKNCAREYGPRQQTQGTVCPFTDQQGPGFATSHTTKPPRFVGKIKKFCPLPEPIRLRNLQNSAPSRTEKKKVKCFNFRNRCNPLILYITYQYSSQYFYPFLTPLKPFYTQLTLLLLRSHVVVDD